MQMSDYLKETEYAVTELISIIWKEYSVYRTLESQFDDLKRDVKSQYQRSEDIAINAEDTENIGLATGMMWETYFGDDKKLFNLNPELERLGNLILTRQFSIESLSGSLLQHAKQGISLVHGG